MLTKTESDDHCNILMSGDVFCSLIHPCIYKWKRGDEYLYIGSSMHGLDRVFDAGHHVINAAEVMPTDIIDVTFYYDIEELLLRKLELGFIRKYRPRLNIAGVRDHVNTARCESKKISMRVTKERQSSPLTDDEFHSLLKR